MKTVTAYLAVLALCFLFGIGLMLTSPGDVRADSEPGCNTNCYPQYRPGYDPTQICEPFGLCRMYQWWPEWQAPCEGIYMCGGVIVPSNQFGLRCGECYAEPEP